MDQGEKGNERYQQATGKIEGIDSSPYPSILFILPRHADMHETDPVPPLDWPNDSMPSRLTYSVCTFPMHMSAHPDSERP